MKASHIPFPMDRDGHDFYALFQLRVVYVGTKLHAYRVIL